MRHRIHPFMPTALEFEQKPEFQVSSFLPILSTIPLDNDGTDLKILSWSILEQGEPACFQKAVESEEQCKERYQKALSILQRLLNERKPDLILLQSVTLDSFLPLLENLEGYRAVHNLGKQLILVPQDADFSFDEQNVVSPILRARNQHFAHIQDAVIEKNGCRVFLRHIQTEPDLPLNELKEKHSAFLQEHSDEISVLFGDLGAWIAPLDDQARFIVSGVRPLHFNIEKRLPQDKQIPQGKMGGFYSNRGQITQADYEILDAYGIGMEQQIETNPNFFPILSLSAEPEQVFERVRELLNPFNEEYEIQEAVLTNNKKGIAIILNEPSAFYLDYCQHLSRVQSSYDFANQLQFTDAQHIPQDQINRIMNTQVINEKRYIFIEQDRLDTCLEKIEMQIQRNKDLLRAADVYLEQKMKALSKFSFSWLFLRTSAHKIQCLQYLRDALNHEVRSLKRVVEQWSQGQEECHKRLMSRQEIIAEKRNIFSLSKETQTQEMINKLRCSYQYLADEAKKRIDEKLKSLSGFQPVWFKSPKEKIVILNDLKTKIEKEIYQKSLEEIVSEWKGQMLGEKSYSDVLHEKRLRFFGSNSEALTETERMIEEVSHLDMSAVFK